MFALINVNAYYAHPAGITCVSDFAQNYSGAGLEIVSADLLWLAQ